MTTDRNARILIVEDDPGIAQLERRVLLRAGYAVEAVAAPDEAVALVATGGFDLAVLDYQLTPQVTGVDLYRRLRAAQADFPAILVTGFSDEAKIIEALRAGVRDVVPKVGEYLEYLPHAVERALDVVRGERKLAASEEALRQANEELERRVEERTAELRASERRFRELAENTPDILSRFDRELRFVFVNPAVEWSTGRPAEAFLGRTNREIGLADELYELWDDAISAVFADGEPREIEFAFAAPDGGQRHFQSRLVAEIAADGRVEHVLSVARDITALRRAVEELARTKEVAESANRAKDHFLAVLSHELRTPLSPVLSTVQLLERTPSLPGELREPLAMIRRNVELEARLIDDLLDLTGIARGKLDLSFEPVDVHEALLQVLEICRSDLIAKRLALSVDLAAPRHVVQADPARLQQLLWNVVKNAVKFTPEGGSVKVRTRGGAAGRLAVEIEDSGIGIEPDTMPHIFDAFEQGGRDVTRLFGGLGLGLAISKTLVELHGGAIGVASAGRGLGTTFVVDLPLASEAERPAAGSPEAKVAAPRAGLRILLVEDHADSREALKQLLEIHDHRVESAGSLAAARALFAPDRFDLMISDVGLPDGSGLDLMRELRARSAGGLKAICLTGFGMDEDVRKSREAGFLAHLTKPVSLQELQAALYRAVAASEVVAAEVGEPV